MKISPAKLIKTSYSNITIDHSNYHNYIDERIFLHTNFLSNPLDTDLRLYLGRRRRLVVIEY